MTLYCADIAEGANAWVESDGAYWTLEKDSGVPVSPTVVAPLPGAPSAGAANARWIREAGVPSVTLAGDVIGPSGANTVVKINGTSVPTTALPDVGKVLEVTAPGVASWVVPGGGSVTGDPNSLLFENPLGTNAITDPRLVAAPIDQFGRPQIWDHRAAAGVGSVLRGGSWQADGDPTSQACEGIVLYGANALGLGPDPAEGGYCRIKPRRIGLAQIIPGVNGGNLFYAIRLDTDSVNGIVMNDDTAAQQLLIDRITGTISFGSSVSPIAAPGSARFFGNAAGTLHGSNAGMQYSSLIANRAQLRTNSYGAHTGVPGMTGFKSRALTIGGLAAVAPGDVLWRATAIGVCGDNASIPLSGLLSFNAKTIAAARIGCDLEVQQSPSTGPQRITWTFEGETGDLLSSLGIVREPFAGTLIGLGPVRIVFAPGMVGTLPPNVVTTWADVMHVINGNPGPIVVACDDTLGACSSTAGTWDMQGRVTLEPAVNGRGTVTTFLIGAGSKLKNLEGIRGYLTLSGTADIGPAMTFDLGPAATSRFRVYDRAILNGNTTGGFPMIDLGNTGRILTMQLDAGTVPLFGTVVNVGATDVLRVEAYNGSAFAQDVLSVAGAASATMKHDASVKFETQAGDLSATWVLGETLQIDGIVRGQTTLVGGVSPLIPVRGLKATSQIHMDLRLDGGGAGTTRYGALDANRVYGAAGSFKVTALAGGALNVADGSTLDWTVYT